MFGFGVQFHRQSLMGSGFDALSQKTVSRSGTKPRFGSGGLIVEDAANELGVSFDPATGARLGYHIGEQFTRTSFYPEIDDNYSPVAGGVLTEVSLGEFGRVPGLNVLSPGSLSGAAMIASGTYTAGDVFSGSLIVTEAAAGDSGQWRLIVQDAVDSVPRIQGTRDDPSNVLDMNRLAVGPFGAARHRLDWAYQVRNTGSHNLFFGPNQTDQNVVGLLLWAQDTIRPAPLPPLSNPTTQVTQLADDVTAPLPAHLGSGNQVWSAKVTLPFEQNDTAVFFDATDGTANNRWRIDMLSSLRLQMLVTVAGVAQTTLTLDGGFSAGEEIDLTASFIDGVHTLSANGASISEVGQSFPSGLTEIALGSTFGGLARASGGVYISSLLGVAL